MVNVIFDPVFEKRVKKIKDTRLKEKVKKQVAKIIEQPSIGKPMRYGRKDTRELHTPPFRPSYHYDEEKQLVIFLDLYHKDEQ